MKRSFLLASILLAITFSPLALADKGTQNHRGTQGQRAVESKQMTWEESIISSNSYVKPYLPAQIVGKNLAYGPCGADGNLDESARGVNCFNVSSVDRKQTWRFRHVAPGGTIDRIWKIQNNTPVLWAVFDRDNAFAVVFASSEAQRFAGSGSGDRPNMASDKHEAPERNAAQEILDAIPQNALQRALGIIGGKGR